MNWLGWYLLGLITGVTLAALLVAAVGRVPRERGGTLTFDSPEARGVFKHARDASAEPGATGTVELRIAHQPPITAREMRADLTWRREHGRSSRDDAQHAAWDNE